MVKKLKAIVLTADKFEDMEVFFPVFSGRRFVG